MNKLIQLSLLLIAASCGPLLHAAPYQLQVNAEVYSVKGADWDSSVAVGTTMTALFNFDTDVAAIYTDASKSGYIFLGLPASITVGNYTAESTYTQLFNYNNDSNFGEGYQFDGFDVTGSLPTSYFNYMGGRLWSNDFSLLSNTEQLIQEFNPAVFQSRDLFMGGFTDPNGTAASGEYVYASIQSYQVKRVPDTGSVAGMLGAAFLALGLLRPRMESKTSRL